MKINPLLANTSLSQAVDHARLLDAPAHRASHSATPGSDRAVAFSAMARHLAQLDHAGHDVNPMRIDEIRNALANGTLDLDPERIADHLIACAHELFTQP